ncbi:MAG: DUF502 domain-containing protein [Candidatus Omnitrophota bacterium]
MLKRIFLTGLAAIIPVVITIYVIITLFHFADAITGSFINKVLQEYLGYGIPGGNVIAFILRFVITIILVFISGVLFHFSRMRLTKSMEKMLFRIPLVNKIYFPVKRIVDFLFFPPSKNFKSVVLVEYPRRGIYSMGFVTNETSKRFSHLINSGFYNVFIPSSPYPLTGFTIIAGKDDLKFLDMGVDEAIKLVISGGLLNPYE